MAESDVGVSPFLCVLPRAAMDVTEFELQLFQHQARLAYYCFTASDAMGSHCNL